MLVVAVDALHLEGGKRADGVSLGIASEINSHNARLRILILDPRNGLALFIRRGIADMHAWADVRAVDAPESSAAHLHQENRLGAGVRLVVFELAENAET